MTVRKFDNEKEAISHIEKMGIIILTEEQLNFLTRLNLQGPLEYHFFGDRVGDEEAKKQLTKMAEYGYVNFDGLTASITPKGKELIKDRTTFFK